MSGHKHQAGDKHQMKLSINLHSIKNPTFTGMVFASYHGKKQNPFGKKLSSSLIILGINKTFRTSPSVAIPEPHQRTSQIIPLGAD